MVQFSIGYNLMKPSPEQLLERQLASPGKQMDGADSARQPMRSGRGPAQNASGTSEDEELLPLREQSALEMQPVSGGLGKGGQASKHRLCEGEARQSCRCSLCQSGCGCHGGEAMHRLCAKRVCQCLRCMLRWAGNCR